MYLLYYNYVKINMRIKKLVDVISSTQSLKINVIQQCRIAKVFVAHDTALLVKQCVHKFVCEYYFKYSVSFFENVSYTVYISTHTVF